MADPNVSQTPRQVAVIGAGGGIGRACVAAFAASGWRILAADRDGDAMRLALDELDLSDPHEAHGVDVRDRHAIDRFARHIGSVDAMIYCAGLVATMPIAETDFDVFDHVMAVNLSGAAHAASAFARTMKSARTGGSMVFIASTAGLRGEANASAYCASKFGLIGLVQSVAAELTACDIRVNAVAPGNVDTPMLRRVAEDIAALEDRSVEAVWHDLAHAGAAQRLIKPEEVASLCVALCAPQSAGLTGATIPIDGGALLLA